LGGARTYLSEKGFDVKSRYVFDIFQVQKHFNLQPSSFYIQNIDIDFIFDLEKILGIKNAILLFDLQGMNGKNPNFSIIRSFQGVSNIEAWNNFLIYEFWYQQKLCDDKLSLLLGLFDLNSEFDVSPAKSHFITPSHGIGTDFALTGKLGPSVFPLTSLALRIRYEFSNDAKVSFAVLDGLPGDTNNLRGTHVLLKNSDGLLIVAEGDFSHNESADYLTNPFFKLGFWYYTDKYTHLVSGIKQWGVYGIIESVLFSEKADKKQGLLVSFRLGCSDPHTNFTDIFIGASLEYQGLIPKRNNDYCGIGFTYSRLTDYYHKRFTAKPFDSHYFDTNAEFYYRFQVTGFLSLQPVFGYFFSPAYNPEFEQYWVAGLRLNVQL
jgi:porin